MTIKNVTLAERVVNTLNSIHGERTFSVCDDTRGPHTDDRFAIRGSHQIPLENLAGFIAAEYLPNGTAFLGSPRSLSDVNTYTVDVYSGGRSRYPIGTLTVSRGGSDQILADMTPLPSE